VQTVLKSGSLYLLEPLGPVQGLLYLYNMKQKCRIWYDLTCAQKQNPNEPIKAVIKFTAGKQVEDVTWIYLGSQMEYQLCKRHFVSPPLAPLSAVPHFQRSHD
jgi:hypothetical protein